MLKWRGSSAASADTKNNTQHASAMLPRGRFMRSHIRSKPHRFAITPLRRAKVKDRKFRNPIRRPDPSRGNSRRSANWVSRSRFHGLPLDFVRDPSLLGYIRSDLAGEQLVAGRIEVKAVGDKEFRARAAVSAQDHVVGFNVFQVRRMFRLQRHEMV